MKLLGAEVIATPGLQGQGYTAETPLGTVRFYTEARGWTWTCAIADRHASIVPRLFFGGLAPTVAEAERVLSELVKRARAWDPELR